MADLGPITDGLTSQANADGQVFPKQRLTVRMSRRRGEREPVTAITAAAMMR